MRYVCLLIFCILGLIFAGFILGVTWVYLQGTAEITIDQALIYLEAARDHHLVYANTPAWWQSYPEQDADWAVAYDQIIDLIKYLAAN